MSVIDVRRREVAGEPLIIGHRGLSSRAPENTLASYRAALELGVAYLECDVHLTKDGVPVVIHDADLIRTTGVAAKVADLTLEQIQQLDAGSWKAPEFAGERIPALEELLRLARDRAVVIIEIKAPGMEQAVVDAIDACAGSEGVVIFAWDAATLDRIRALKPDLTVALLVERPPIDREKREALFELAAAHRIPILAVENRDLDRAFFEADLDVWVWTVNEPEEMRRLRDLGAAGIISDYADVARRAIASAV